MRYTSLIFIGFLTSCLLFHSCTKHEKELTTEDSFISYVSNSRNTLFFGKVTLKDIIKNLAFKDIPKLNILLTKEISTLSKGLNLNEPIYFTIDNLLQANGKPNSVYLFIKVKNKDQLSDKLSSLGYLIEPGKESTLITGEYLSGKITSNLAILHFSKNTSKESVNKVFEKTHLSRNSMITKIIYPKSTFSAHVHLENMQKLLDKQSMDRPIANKEELLALYRNSYVSSDFYLNDEKFEGEIHFNFNKALKSRLFLKNNASENLTEIITNDFITGLGLSFDPLKADLFISDFYPSLISDLTKNNFTLQLAILSLGNTPISNLTNGNLSFSYNNSSAPTCKINLGNKATQLSKIGAPYLNFLNIPNLQFKGNILSNIPFSSNKTQISNYSFPDNTGFLLTYYSKNDTKIRNLNDQTKFLDVIESFTFYLNNNGGKIELKSKKKKEGILHQIANIYIEELKKVVN